MSALHLNDLLPALGTEGSVIVFKGQRGYEVSFRYGGKQHNRKLKTRKYSLAKERAAKVFAEVVHGERDAAQARTIEGVYAELSELKQLVRNFILSNTVGNSGVPAGSPVPVVGKPITEALSAFLEEKKRAGVSTVHYGNLDYRCGSFVKYLDGVKVADVARITREHVLGWVNAKGEISNKTWNGYVADVLGFMNFCRVSGWRMDRIEIQKRKVKYWLCVSLVFYRFCEIHLVFSLMLKACHEYGRPCFLRQQESRRT